MIKLYGWKSQLQRVLLAWIKLQRNLIAIDYSANREFTKLRSG